MMYFKKTLHNEAFNNLIELGNKNGFITSHDIKTILPSFLLSSDQLPKVIKILEHKHIEFINSPKKEIKFQKYKKKSHNLAILELIEIAQSDGFITSSQIDKILPKFLLDPLHLNPILEILKKNHVRVISESSVKNDLYVIDVKRVPGPSLNPQGVYWKGDMQIVTTNQGKYIDTPPNVQYRNETPGYDWSSHVGGEPLIDFITSNSTADYPWIKKKNINSKQSNINNSKILEKNIDDIRVLISKDESSTCEFKESAVWGPGSSDKARIDMGKFQILKAIAGFSNSKKGGVLLIGVSDDKKIIGLEKDFHHRQNKDKWMQILIGNLKKAFGEDFSPSWLNQYFVSDEDRDIYVIEISPNSEPIFLGDDFYVRDGNTTKPLTGKSQYSFIFNRFPNLN